MLHGREAYKHLMNRAGFGAHPLELARWKSESVVNSVDRLFRQSQKARPLKKIEDPRPRRGDVAKLKVLLQAIKSKKKLKQLNLAWLDQMGESKAVLREKMTLFWHDHFSTHVQFPILMQEQNNTIRKHALGSFRELLHAMSKDPAMILYLNNQQNKKAAPNENFAREVMELFSLGEGHYSEKDIKEAARAFTGWHINGRGYFEFNSKQHDYGTKTVFGQTGDFDGDEIIDMILENPQTATYICTKVFRYFVNPEVDSEIVEALAADFYQSDYDISRLMRMIFTSSWFYDQKNVAVRIKSPTELLVQHKKWLNARHQHQEVTLEVQEVLGQVLFFPPNVAGWPGGRSWIDSSTLVTRMRMPLVFFDNRRATEKAAWSVKRADKLPSNCSWKYVLQAVDGMGDDEVVAALCALCLAIQPSSQHAQNLAAFVPVASREELVRYTVTRIMALPEFQLC